MSRRRGDSDSDALRVMPWWWAGIGTATSIVLGAACWLIVWSIAGHSAALQIEAIKVGLSVSAGVGAAGALLLAFRRQLHSEHVARDATFDAVQRRVTELYTKAVEQLGHDRAEVRLGGLYALERLAQDNAEHRQTVVDVICAYLRMPFERETEENNDRSGRAVSEERRHDARQELQVRMTAQRLLSRHLQDPDITRPPVPYWKGMIIDLSGAHLIEADFSHCRVYQVDFSDTIFDGTTWFTDSMFEELIEFRRAQFVGEVSFAAGFLDEAHFRQAHFHQDVSFSLSDFRGGADFADALFDRNVSFERTKFRYTFFDGAHFKALADFCKADFGWGDVKGAHFNGEEPDFTEATVKCNNRKTIWPSPWQEKPLDDDTNKAVLVRRRTRKPKPPTE